jgi:hypothetical protein
MTDRISDQSLIQLAKKQYEEQKRYSMPSEVFHLVSKGMVYPKTHPLRNGTIEMRYMTAYDEDILTNSSYIQDNIVLDKLLEALIVTPVDYSTIAKIDKNGLIVAARIVSYGKDYDVIVKDPKTSAELKRTVDLTKLKNSEFNLQSDDNGEFDYTLTDGTKVKFKFLSTGDAQDLTISEFLAHTITQINDTRDTDAIRDFIRYKFLARESKQFRKYIIDNTPSITMSYDFEGEDGSTFTSGFPFGLDVFWF